MTGRGRPRAARSSGRMMSKPGKLATCSRFVTSLRSIAGAIVVVEVADDDAADVVDEPLALLLPPLQPARKSTHRSAPPQQVTGRIRIATPSESRSKLATSALIHPF